MSGTGYGTNLVVQVAAAGLRRLTLADGVTPVWLGAAYVVGSVRAEI
jgi:hypothetical protein